MFDRLKEEINSIKARDPAVRSALEVIFLLSVVQGGEVLPQGALVLRTRAFLHCPVDITELPQQNRH